MMLKNFEDKQKLMDNVVQLGAKIVSDLPEQATFV